VGHHGRSRKTMAGAAQIRKEELISRYPSTSIRARRDVPHVLHPSGNSVGHFLI
jgi:hypothetical protein